ncbi:DUF6036 family nucleotidyltransferase [Mucilaginibacter psychrotolerans]|uniref:DUF6036 domain-containing protein n=1 Tax=Mucilaginibacter psychrotolerans TaxID=1524096 RepID=A0A4Y8S4Z3_9SPHI|nr:DUF6036 family nucleotidyltransferase [Mucilaginibacter psychrotolerans]TFF33537.1 hypothetical protein E2R66_25525 [Mucilaginibacter psychrotolerans]
MGNIFKDDFKDFVKALNFNKVRYILVGGFSVVLHGYERTTGDMDIWVDRTADNYKRLKMAFLHFGMPVFSMTEDVFLHDPEHDVFTFGRPPTAIDIMIEVLGMNFDECFRNATFFQREGIKVRTIHINDLITAKKASGRHKDLDDIENLTKNK